MKRSIREVATMATVILAVTAGSSSAQAQVGRYGYPGGYGGYGWGGWGGGGTVQGDYARGLGNLAAGMGQYNEQTAVARSINADTAMKWNEYVYQSQMVTNRKFREKLDREKGTTLAARQRIDDRLRNNPDPADITSGEALNVALDEINNPRVYIRGLETAKAKIDGPSIRNIPFQYASAAIVTSIHDLVNNGPPDLLKRPEFDTDRNALKAAGAKIREKTEAGEQPADADIVEAQTRLTSMRKQLEANFPRNTTPGFTDAQRYLRATFALTRMLQGPSIDLILSGVEKRKEATFGELLGFMNSFNLRFGRATTPDQRNAYSQIYPLLARARDEAAANLQPVNTQAANVHPHDFFSGMDPNDLESKKPLPPAPPSPNN